MPLSKEHKAKTRSRILNVAADQFRRFGYDGVGVDKIMNAAGLTRGGFYAHFASKRELFVEVLRSQHDLIRRLQTRTDGSDVALRQAGADIFRQYLSPDNFNLVAPNCTLSTLSMDAFRASDEATRCYADAIQSLLTEINRSFQADNGVRNKDVLNTMSLAIGALSLARLANDASLRDKLLNAAADQISDWFDVT